jgi:hypothetical protein
MKYLIEHSYALWLGGATSALLDSETLALLRWEWWASVIPVIIFVNLREFLRKVPDNTSETGG